MHIQSMYLKTMIDLLHVKERDNCDDPEGLRSYKSVEHCDKTGRGTQTVVSELNGTLTRTHSSFAYYMLVAFEAGSPFRGLILLLLWPFICALRFLVSEAASVQMLIFISTVGIKETEIEGVGRAVLCKFYLEDMHPHAYQVFLACGRRCVVTSSPRVMVEPFLTEYMKVDLVLGAELHSVKGFCTGLLKGPGVLVGDKKREAVERALQNMPPDLGLGSDPITSSSFLSLCKEGYIVTETQVAAVTQEDYGKPLIFHDGRLARRPTPMVSLFIYLWFPIGLVLSVLRLFSWVLLPVELATPLGAFLGVRVRITGAPPLLLQKENEASSRGSLYVCTHRTLLDPIFLSVGLRRRVAAVTYSLSKVSEMLSPLKTVTLSRRREEDARAIESVLQQGADLVICPEGTTCREPYLLRFSPLFAEMTNDIVPVGMRAGISLFHGTTARGFKGMDPFYFLMNPRPSYTVTILDPLPKEETCASGKSSFNVANDLQKLMGSVMGYQCTNLTRKDKYRILAGNDGLVPASKGTTNILLKRSHSINETSNSHLASESLTMLSSLWFSFCKCFPSKQG
ncbi:hypothetical protein GOP47_0017235 [Adiantum capillus-veneris]|uniref:Phospholipid/glycerol acyltransferase domain-containing protein n=1 Tax=Adiantum capillus-veneris TaxID=13818 RepID=A0A9D4ZCX9_ADICA|nr:hypothetical protein GOP47_0017235 [Adiantum capillus-veneris]